MRVCHIDKKKLFDAFEEVYNSSHLTEGKMVKRFEEEVSNLHNRHTVAFNSAGSALFSVMNYMKRRKRTNRVLVSNNTFYATAAMAREAGWDVVVCDCGPDFSLSVKSIRDSLSKHKQDAIDGVILTHVGGALASEYKEIAHLCKTYGWFLVEDAAHAFGTVDKNYRAGDLGDVAVFSFYPTKAVPVGEGGLVVCNDEDMHTYLLEFRNYGKYIVDYVRYRNRGFNFRMDEWTAAVAWLQVERLGDLLEAREELASRLQNFIPLHSAFKGRPTNWYKYIVPAECNLMNEAGKVYNHTDQLTGCMGVAGYYPVSWEVANSHKCVPFHEGLYSDMTDQEVYHCLLGE